MEYADDFYDYNDYGQAKQPFPVSAFIQGYVADKYDVDAAQSMERANERIKKSAEQNFRQTVQGYASVIPEAMSVQLQNARSLPHLH